MELLTYGILGILSKLSINNKEKNNNEYNNENNIIIDKKDSIKIDDIYKIRNYNVISKNDKIINDNIFLQNDNNNYYNINNNDNTLGIYDNLYLKENHNFVPNIDERNKNYNNNSSNKLNIMSGYTIENFDSKSEIEPMFNNYNYMTNDYDLFNTDKMKTRMILEKELRNEKPFNSEMIGINGYGYNTNIRIIPKTVDNLRTINNPKLTYNLPIIYGNKTLQPNYNLEINNNKNKIIINDTINYSVPSNNVNKKKMDENITIDINNRELFKTELFGGIESDIKKYNINNNGSVEESNKISYNIEPTNIISLIGKQQIYDKQQLKKTLKELINNTSTLDNALMNMLLNTCNRIGVENTKKNQKETLHNITNYNISNIHKNLKINKIDDIKNTLRGILDNLDNNNNFSSVQKIHYKDLETEIKTTLKEVLEENKNININVDSKQSIKINNINDLKLTLRQILNKINIINYKGNDIYIPIINDIKLTLRNVLDNIYNNNNLRSNKQDVKINNFNNIKDTLRQNINNIDVINFKGNENTYVNISDEIKSTLRELNNKLDIINFKGQDKSYVNILDEIKTTLKELALDFKVGNIYNNKSNVNYSELKNILLNCDKEQIAQGRDPTNINVMLSNDKSQINVRLREENITQRENYGYYNLDNNFYDNKINIKK